MCVFKADVTMQVDTTLLKCMCLNTLNDWDWCFGIAVLNVSGGVSN